MTSHYWVLSLRGYDSQQGISPQSGHETPTGQRKRARILPPVGKSFFLPNLHASSCSFNVFHGRLSISVTSLLIDSDRWNVVPWQTLSSASGPLAPSLPRRSHGVWCSGILGEALRLAATQLLPAGPGRGVLFLLTPRHYQEMMQIWKHEPFGPGKIMCDTLHVDQVMNGCPDFLHQNIKRARMAL